MGWQISKMMSGSGTTSYTQQAPQNYPAEKTAYIQYCGGWGYGQSAYEV